jgi:hypothetical protein
MGASWADYDGDGDEDLFVTNRGPNRLFQNQGDGTFRDVAAEAGVADSLWSAGSTWGDFDRDGLLDLYVCNYVDYNLSAEESAALANMPSGPLGLPFSLNPNSFDPEPNRLYHNRGDGTFEEIAEEMGVANPEGRSLSAAFCDLDGNGWLDLYICNDVSANRLYSNVGRDLDDPLEPVLFVDFSFIAGVADPRGAMGLSIGEVGGDKFDGLPDLFISHWLAQENALYQSLGSGKDLEYRDRSREMGLGELSLDMVGWGCAWADFDLDGRVDVAVANGSTLERPDHPLELIQQPMFLFRNGGGDRFYSVEAIPGEYSARGLAVADFDCDGDPDMAVSVNRGQPLLLVNETAGRGHSLVIVLKGPAAARFGARAEIEASGARQVRWMGADVSYLSGHAPEFIFGLGASQKADRVVIGWADGAETSLVDIPAGRLEIAHPEPLGWSEGGAEDRR